MKPKPAQWLSVCCGAPPWGKTSGEWITIDGGTAKPMCAGHCYKCKKPTTFEQADEESD